MTQVLNSKNDPDAARDQALRVLRRGEILVFPTDTVYGIGGDATDERVTARVAEGKGRLPDKPFPWLVSDSLMAERFGVFSESARELATERWPGGTTLVVFTQRGDETIALRVPAHPWLQALIAAFGKPLIGTSANRSGEAPATTAETVTLDADLIIDGGVCDGSPSEVIDCTVSPPRVLRPR